MLIYNESVPDLTGASVSRPSSIPFIRHRGTCTDRVCQFVVDTMPQEGVRWVTLPSFADGYRVNIDSIAPTPIEGKVRVGRVLPLIGKLPYQAAATCDHVATYAETGNWFSPQGTTLLVLAGLAWIAFSQND